jgi:hypothetical protein
MVTAELDKLANLEGKSPSDLKEAEKWAYEILPRQGQTGPYKQDTKPGGG